MGRILAAAGWLAFLAWIVLGGHAATFVAPWQATLLAVTVAVFAVLVVAGGASGAAPPGGWPGVAVHALPLALFAAIGPVVLGSHGLRPLDQVVGAAVEAPVRGTDGRWRADLHGLRDDALLEGGPVEVIGRLAVLPETGRRRGQAQRQRPALFRHLITCCAADAQGIHAWLSEPPPAGLPIDSWVRVTGTVDARATPGLVPVITVERIEPIPEPDRPYLLMPMR